MYLLAVEDPYFSLAVIGSVISLVVLYFIIRGASRSGVIIKHQQGIIMLLIELCKKQGVTTEEIDKIKMFLK